MTPEQKSQSLRNKLIVEMGSASLRLMELTTEIEVLQAQVAELTPKEPEPEKAKK